MTVTTPRGLRDVLPEEALWREQIVQAVSGRFAEEGYLPVETPMLEQGDLLADADAADKDTFRLFDSDGNLLMLRPDVTLPIARMVSTRLRDKEGPFRLRYAAPVFCESDPLRGESRQFTQLGIELIGENGLDADAEVLLLMARALEAAGLSGYVISLGSVRPLDACRGPAAHGACAGGGGPFGLRDLARVGSPPRRPARGLGHGRAVVPAGSFALPSLRSRWS